MIVSSLSRHNFGNGPLTLCDLPIVEGFSVDDDKTQVVEQIFSIEMLNGLQSLILSAPLPIFEVDKWGDRRRRTSLSLDLNAPRHGLSLRMPFSEHGFGEPEFFLSTLINRERLTHREFELRFDEPYGDPLNKILEAFGAQSETTSRDSLRWIIDGDRDFFGTHRKDAKPTTKESCSPRSNCFHDSALSLAFRCAGAFLARESKLGIFFARLAVFEQNGFSRVVNHAHEILECLDINQDAPPAWLTLTPPFLSSSPVHNCSADGYLVPWTAPLRNLHAAWNASLIAAALGADIAAPSREDVQELVSLRNQHNRTHRQLGDRPRRISLEFGTRGEVLYIRRGQHAKRGDIVGLQNAQETLNYTEKCNSIFRTLRLGTPRASDILWAMEAYDRGRSDWPIVEVLAKIWCKYNEGLRDEVLRLIAASNEKTVSESDLNLDPDSRITGKDLHRQICTKHGLFTYKLQRVLEILRRTSSVEVKENSGARGRKKFSARIRIEGPSKLTTKWENESSKRAAIGKASYFALRLLVDHGHIPIEYWEDPLRYPEGTLSISMASRRTLSEPNGEYGRFCGSLKSPYSLLRALCVVRGWEIENLKESLRVGKDRAEAKTIAVRVANGKSIVGWTTIGERGLTESTKAISRRVLRALLANEYVSLEELKELNAEVLGESSKSEAL